MSDEEMPIFEGIPKLPLNCWIKDAFDYVSSKSHAPDLIIFWSIIAFCGACLKDRIWFDFAGKTVFPNFPLLIIAGSGVGKTSSLDIIERLFFEELPYRIPENVTSEALFKNFAEKGTNTYLSTSAYWITPEMGSVFGKKDYQSGIVTSLTRALDNPKNMTVSRMNKDDIVIKNTAILNWICASTFPWLLEYCKEGTSAGGFLPRIETIHCSDDPKFTRYPSSDADVELSLNLRLKAILKDLQHGKRQWIDEIENVRYEFYQDQIKCNDENVKNYIARQGESFVRLYLILSVFLRKLRSTSAIILLAKNCSKLLLNNKLSLYRAIIMRNIIPTSKRVLKSINTKLSKRIDYNVKYVDLMKSCRVKTNELEPLLRFYADHGVIVWDGGKGEHGFLTPKIDPDKFLEDFYRTDHEDVGDGI